MAVMLGFVRNACNCCCISQGHVTLLEHSQPSILSFHINVSNHVYFAIHMSVNWSFIGCLLLMQPRFISPFINIQDFTIFLCYQSVQAILKIVTVTSLAKPIKFDWDILVPQAYFLD